MNTAKHLTIAALSAGLLFAGSLTTKAETTGEPYYADIYIVSPEAEEVFSGSPADVYVSVEHNGGHLDAISSAELYVDDVLVTSSSCNSLECIDTHVELALGVHEIYVLADNGKSDSRTIYVEEANETTGGTTTGGDTGGESGEESGSDTGGDTGGDTSGDTSGGGDEGDDTGGDDSSDDAVEGCSVDGQRSSPWGLLTLPALVLLAGLRRRD